MQDSLRQIFGEYGPIASIFVKIVKTETGKRFPYGFVSFETNEDAKKAMQVFG